ncbi:Phospholipase/carboxylesterase/thioesterase [Halteromyces radiatus]|uniref:Phospholipase/carboxylesterase/thioesterase n=1 Tax=Halteromyces radiatus TaxID=101107 RepID=UPI002220BFB5|nr:Phospholipase/carboxylesterase/thioesterase [Halteromyces radiatus]KAI8076790.1 Phospholipase/carboxylesterase/thioesterase [Halteromyces radiatus]
MTSALTSVVVGAKAKHTATVLFFHGLGDSGHGWSFLADELSGLFPYVKWVLPNAPAKPITLNAGFQMPAWFDLTGLDKSSLKDEDQKGMLESLASVNQLIRQEVDNGIPADRILVGGFSQGGVMSLLTGLTSEYKLSGIIGCSCWLAMADKMKMMGSDANKKTPILMCHGDMDSVVQYQFGEESAERLQQYGYDVTFKKYRGLAHSANPEEIQDIAKFIKDRLPSQ